LDFTYPYVPRRARVQDFLIFYFLFFIFYFFVFVVFVLVCGEDVDDLLYVIVGFGDGG
jgi:hypothetical protein